MTWEHLHEEEARSVGESGQSVQELADIAPPCPRCGKQESVPREEGQDLCSDCFEG